MGYRESIIGEKSILKFSEDIFELAITIDCSHNAL